MIGGNTDIISQRTVAGGPVFRFNDLHLDYFGIEWDFKVKYEDITGPSQYRRSSTSDRPTVFTFIYLMFLGLVLLSYTKHYPQYGPEAWRAVGTFVGLFVGIVIGICGSIYYMTHQEYTVIPTRNGHIHVVWDNQHDAVIQKMLVGRLKSLRLLSAPDSANSPNEELAKLKWLHGEGAITEDEYTQLCSRIAG